MIFGSVAIFSYQRRYVSSTTTPIAVLSGMQRQRVKKKVRLSRTLCCKYILNLWYIRVYTYDICYAVILTVSLTYLLTISFEKGK